MTEFILISLVGAIINMLFALLIPCLLKDTTQPFLEKVKKIYSTHKQLIIISSIIVFITIYLALSLTPNLDNLSNLSNLGNDDYNSNGFNKLTDIFNRPLNSINKYDNNSGNYRIINLSKL